MPKLNLKILSVLMSFFLTNCLEEISDPLAVKYDNASDLITYIETNTNILNDEDKPVLVKVDELFQNLNSYLVLDIRDKFDFESGHVPGAVNVEKKELLNYLKSINTFDYQKIVIVSSTGQLASYTSCLMNIAGMGNVYALDRGMTFWNSVFADELRNAGNDGKWYFTYRLMPANKPPKSNQTPTVVYSSNPITIEKKLEDRIQTLLNEATENLFITGEEFSNLYTPTEKKYSGNFVIYTLPDSVLHSGNLPGGQVRSVYGPQSMIFYDIPGGFRVSDDLLTLPLNQNIVMYSPNGQRSSFYQAYLKLIGFDNSKVIKYGAIALLDRNFITTTYIRHYKTNEIIDTIYTPTYLTPYGFREGWIRNYDYDTGP